MKKNSNIFQDDIKVPEIVLQKADEAFAGIQTEGRSTMKKNNQTENRKHTFWRNPAAVAACTCIIVAGSVTAGAAVHHVWSRGMQGAVRATDVGRILRTFKIKKNVEVTDNGKIII